MSKVGKLPASRKRSITATMPLVLLILACWGSSAVAATGTVKKSVAEPCARAEALYSAGYYKDAEAEYKKLLGEACVEKKQAKQELATARKLPEKQIAKEQIERAERLQNAGFEAQARELVKEVAQGSKEAIPTKLRAPTQRTARWRGRLGELGPAVRTGLEALAVLAGVIVVLLLVLTGSNALAMRIKRSAQLTGFTGSGDATLTAVLGSALSSTIARMTDERAIGKVDWQVSTEPKFAIPVPVAEAVPQAQLLAGLVQMLDGLLFRRLAIVSGTVHPVHEHRGAGVTLIVGNRSGRKVEQVTVWESEFALKEAGEKTTAAVRYERLILPVAVWLAYSKMLGVTSKKAPLNVHAWRSYALFALGELVPDRVKQKWLYEKALDLDDGNLGARLNLAALLLRRSELDVPNEGDDAARMSGDRAGWRACLEEAGRHLETVACRSSPKKDPIWYRARYMQAVRLLYLSRGGDALTILACMRQAISVYGEEPRVSGLVDALEQPIAIMKLSAELTKYRKVKDLTCLPRGWLSATAEYNLACFWARYAGAAGEDEDKRKERTLKAVISLRRATERNREAAGEARIDPAFDPIRPSAGFKAAVKKSDDPPEEQAKPSRYSITLDPGPELLALAGMPPPA